SVTIDVHALPSATMTVEAPNPTTLCEGEKTTLVFSFPTGSVDYTITFKEGEITRTINATPLTSGKFELKVNPVQTTTYELLKVKDGNNCEVELSPTSKVKITVNNMPLAAGPITGAVVVCQGDTATYKIDAIDHSTSYEWNVPATLGEITENAGTSIKVKFKEDFTSGTISVRGANDCGMGAYAYIGVTPNFLPLKPIKPSGPVNVCEGDAGMVYRINPVDHATSYDWSVPVGLEIVGDASGTVVEMKVSDGFSGFSGNILVTAKNDCGVSATSEPLTVNVSALPIANAGFNQEGICKTDITLDATLPVGMTGAWRVTDEGTGIFADRTDPKTSVSNISRGDNIFEWTVTNGNGCSASALVTITNDQLPVSASADRQVICGESVSVSGSKVPEEDTDRGYWTVVPSGNIVDGENRYTEVYDLPLGVSTITWNIERNTCISSASVDILNNASTNAEIIHVLIVNDTIDLPCGDTSIALTGNAPQTAAGEKAKWQVVSGSAALVGDVSSASINVTGIAKGETVLEYTISRASCSNTAKVVIRNNKLDVDAGVDRTICGGDVIMDATPAGKSVTGQWKVDTGSAISGDWNSPTTTFSDLSAGTNEFIWTLTKNNCPSSHTVTITNNAGTKAEITEGILPICEIDPVLKGNSINPSNGEVGYWTLVEGAGQFDDVSNPETTVHNLGSGTNVFRWNITHKGCTTSADQEVQNLSVEVNAGRDTIVCEKDLIVNANTPPIGMTGMWTPLAGYGGATIGDAASSTTNVAVQHGVNGLVWMISNGTCISMDTLFITNSSPILVNAGPDFTVTGGTTELKAKAIGPGETGTWTLIEGGATISNEHDPSTKITNLQRGDNVFRWTVNSNGCVEYDQVVVTNDEIVEPDAGVTQNVCTNETELHANDPGLGLYEWSVKSGSGIFEYKNKPKTKVSNLAPGKNVFLWTINYTNNKSPHDSVIIYNYAVSEAFAGVDREICDNAFVLEANKPLIGTPAWTLISGSGTFDKKDDPSTTVRGLSKGVNVLKYEISQNICKSVDSVRITNNLPTDSYAGRNDVICTDSIELFPNTPAFGVGEWQVVEGAADFEGNWAKKLAPGVNKLAWVITSGSCSSTSIVEITNNQPSDAFAGNDDIVCVDQANLSAGSIDVPNIGKWELIIGSGVIEDPANRSTVVTGLGQGRNRFRWTVDNNGCKASDDVEISYSLIEANAGIEQVLCADSAILQANVAYPGIGTWGIVGGAGAANIEDPHNPYTIVRALDQGENILTWTIENDGCSSESKVTIINNNPSRAKAGDNQDLCDNQVTLSANDPEVGAGHWSVRNGSGNFSSAVYPANPMDDHSPGVEGLLFGSNIFRWTVENKGCISFDDVEVNFNRIDAEVGQNQEICADETILEANNAFPGIGTWSITGGTSQAVFDDRNNPNTSVSNLGKGPNTLKWTIFHKGCQTSKEVVVTNNGPDAAYAGNSQTLCDSVAELNARPVINGDGHWEVLTGSGIVVLSDQAKTGVIGLSKGDNVFRWVVQNESCVLTDEVLIVNNKPSVPYAGADSELCSSQVALKASPPTFGNGLWSIVKGSGNFDDPANPSAIIRNLSPGENVLRWTLTQGQCTLVDEVTFVNNTPTTANAGPDIEDCKDWADLDANKPLTGLGTGSWTLVSGKGEFEDSTNPKTAINQLGFGENILMWTIQKGSCFSTDKVMVFNKVPDQAEAGADRSVCEDYVTLNANNPVDGAGVWTVISGKGEFENPNQFNTIVRKVGYGTNVYKWIIAYGECTTEDIVTVTSNKAAPFAGEDEIVYTRDYTLKAANPGDLQGSWSIVAGGGTFEDVNFFNTTVRNLPFGKSTFRWTIVTDGCSAYDDVTIDYREVPEAGFIMDVEAGCYPLTVEFTNYTVGGSVFNWEFGDGAVSSLRNPTHTYEEPGEYSAILTVPGPDGVDDVFSKTVVVHDHPIADFNVTPEVVWIPGDGNKYYDLSIDAVSWFWDFGDGSTSEEQNPAYEYQDAGMYSVTLTVLNKYGCENILVKDNAVEALLSGFVIFPNAFKPRPGGSGDLGRVGEQGDAIFKPKYRDVDEFHLQIFNRWGQLIFESHEVSEGWDGTYKDELAPQAVYVWKVSGRFINGKEFREAGSVLLVR
ncbi:MAG: PKD domain-containing protein, partial [Marinilabiliaceae bacterium]|nr:PKD domain-containing protein [Marinilabiliaceae bacterium]